MTRRVHSEHVSDGDVETVFAILTDPSWPERKAEVLRDGSRVLRREQKADGGVVVVVSRELPAGVPRFLERFLPRDGRVTQTEEWGPADGVRRSGTWTGEIPGAPAQLGGTMRLEPVASGSRYVIDGEVTVRVPVIGGKAEAFIADKVERLAAKEGDLLRAALAAG